MSSWQFYYPEALLPRLEKELPVKAGKTPNAKQWEMITSRENNICVCAGAGSGKTLSLIWRVIFLYVYLRVPLNEITVLSFTRKAVEDFREKLLEMLDKFGVNVDPAEIKKTVRTFHSKILEFGRQSTFAVSSNKMFEHQKAPEDIKGSSEFSILEFKTEKKSVARLCQMLSKSGFKLGVMSAPANTITWLNEILQVGDLWERMLAAGHKLGITDEIKQLAKRTDKLRGVLYEDLKYTEQAAVKMLNRLIIEALYPNETPKRIDDDDEDELIGQIFNRSNIPIE